MARNLVELAVEQDDDAMEAYLEGNEPTVETLRALIRKGTLAIDFVPVLAGRRSRTRACSRC
jgi:elongation factor G